MVVAFFVALAVALGWIALAVLCIGRSRHSRRLGPADAPAGPGAPTVAAVVPARNEAGRVGETLSCLMTQDYPHLTILVVDDQSTDGTAAAVRRSAAGGGPEAHPARLLPGVERPGGWVGKTWALHQGVEATDSEWVWMVDADLWLHPRALSTAVALADRSGADFVSFLGRPRCETFWQGAIATALVQILALLYPLRRVNDPGRPDALAHGAFILIRRSMYERVGGIASVRSEIVEDIRFAARVKAGGGRIVVAAAPSLSQTHMYGTLGDIWRGLRKNAFAGMNYKLHKYATGALLGLLMTCTSPAATMIGLLGLASPWWPAPGPFAWLAVGLLGWLAQAAATLPVIVFLDLPFAFAFALPAGLGAYAAITTSSVWHHLRGRILWKDRAFSSREVTQHSGGTADRMTG